MYRRFQKEIISVVTQLSPFHMLELLMNILTLPRPDTGHFDCPHTFQIYSLCAITRIFMNQLPAENSSKGVDKQQ